MSLRSIWLSKHAWDRSRRLVRSFSEPTHWFIRTWGPFPEACQAGGAPACILVNTKTTRDFVSWWTNWKDLTCATCIALSKSNRRFAP